MEETVEPSIFDDEQQIQVVYAGFWERFGALFLDGLLLAPLSIINYYNQSSWKSIPLLLLSNLVALLYKPLLEYLYSATLGKKALSLVVVNSSYGKINAGDAVLRNIFGLVVGLSGLVISVYTFSSLAGEPVAPRSFGDFDTKTMLTIFYSLFIFILYLADAICLVANRKKQSLHDLIAKTYVIRK